MNTSGVFGCVALTLLLAARSAGVAPTDVTVPAGVSFIGGVTVDSISGLPVPGVYVYVDNVLRDSSNSEGRYRIKGLSRGDYVLRFELPGAIAVMEPVTVSATIDQIGQEYYLDVLLPSVEHLVARRCREEDGRTGPAALLGRVGRAGADPAVDYEGWLATVTWSRWEAGEGKIPAAEADGVGRVVMPVEPNGGFLVCHLPGGVTARVVVQNPLLGPDRAPLPVPLPASGVATVYWPES